MGWAYCGTDSQGRNIGYAIEAVCDEEGCDAEVMLYVEDEGEVIESLPWPDDWPEWVSVRFLRSYGYEVITA